MPPLNFAVRRHRNVTLRIYLFVAVLELFAVPCQAIMVGGIPAQLSIVDQRLVLKAACLGAQTQKAKDIEASIGSPGSEIIDVIVRCAPRRKENLPSSSHHTNCDNRSGMWHCAEGHEDVQTQISESLVVTVAAINVDPETAIEVVKEAAKLVVPPFGESAVSFMSGECLVARDADDFLGEFPLFTVGCDDGHIELFKTCPPNGCQYVVIGGGWTLR